MVKHVLKYCRQGVPVNSIHRAPGGPLARAEGCARQENRGRVDSAEPRVTFSGGKPTITGGPFAEAELELRQVLEAEDFGAEFTPELREQEEQLRAVIEKRQR